MDTISTTSGELTAGNDPGTLNQLGPNFLTYDPSAGKIFVSYDPSPDSAFGPGDAGGVAVIQSATGKVTGNIVDGIQPDDVLYDPDNGYVYAVDWRSSQVLVIDPTNDTVVTTIDTGETSDPVAIALDPVNDHLFVTVSASDEVGVIDGSNNTLIGQLAAGTAPWWDLYDPENGELYVENADGNNVSVFNASTGATVTSIQVSTVAAAGGGGPIGFAPSDGDLFVPVVDAGAAVVSGATNTVIGTIPQTYAPGGYWGFAFDPYLHGGAMLATEWGGSNLTVINATVTPTVAGVLPADGSATGILVAGAPAEVYVAAGAYGPTESDRITRFNASTLAPIAPIQLGTTPGAEVYDPNTGCMAVALTDTGQVLLVNVSTGRVESAISVGAAPASLAFDPADGDVYVANLQSDNVSILNATGVVDTLTVGVSPTAVVADPGSGDVYVANSGNSTISVLSGDSVVRSFPVEPDSGPDALAFDAATSRLFVVNDDFANVSEYDPTNGSLLGSFSVGADPVGITLDPNNQQLYVLSSSGDGVHVSSATTLHYVTTVSVGDDPGAISYDPANGLVYVANSGDNNLSAIDPSSDMVLGTPAVGLAPGEFGGLAPDGSLGSLYVSNWLSGSVSVVATGSAAVEFGESGLPLDSLWSVTFQNETEKGPGSIVFRAVPIGTFSFSVGPVPGYSASPSGGTIQVAGMVNLSITFQADVAPSSPAVPSAALVAEAGIGGATSAVAVRLIVWRFRRPSK
ncbi:MAG: YncE family protein [Thermoplasmata archaeon]|nr:YncE family protein [Thermoplasmata archaeon]